MTMDTEAAKEARNKYQREWRARNPDRVRAISERYWLKKAGEIMQRDEAASTDQAPGTRPETIETR